MHGGQVHRALDSRSEGRGLDYHCWLCVEVSGKLLIPYYLCPRSSNGYLVEQKIGKWWMALAAENELNSHQRKSYRIKESTNTRGVNCKACWTHGDRLNIYIYVYIYFGATLPSMPIFSSDMLVEATINKFTYVKQNWITAKQSYI